MKARVYVAGQNLLTFAPFPELIRKCPSWLSNFVSSGPFLYNWFKSKFLN